MIPTGITIAGLPGGTEIWIILFIVLLLFGRRIPGIARSLGQGISQFKKGLSEPDAEVEAQVRKLQALEEEFQAEVAAMRDSAASADTVELQEVRIRPRKTDIAVERVALVWTPWKVGTDGIAEPAF